MKKKYCFPLVGVLLPMAVMGQSATDAFRIAQPDMKGTARFMSMGGAFGALGGDLSTLSQNPGGLGVYRSNELGFTLDLDCQNAKSSSSGFSMKTNQTKFLLNNIGGVLTIKLDNNVMPNINFGFTYNKGASFNRSYGGGMRLQNSLSNYIAGISNANHLGVHDVEYTDRFDPYNPNNGFASAPWISILGYNSFLITPQGDPGMPQWVGQWGDGTSGNGFFHTIEKGGLDEYNIAIGGNINNVLYWGMDFDFTNVSYSLDSYWDESLNDAYVKGPEGMTRCNADWDLYNFYHVNGSGFNYKIGVIVKPIQELRIGLAFHTPTWMSLTETYYGEVQYRYGGEAPDYANTNDGMDAYNNYNFRTPLRFIGSVAGVLFNKLIVSADYELTPYNDMKFSEQKSYNYFDYYYYPPYNDFSAPALENTRSNYIDIDPYEAENQDIKQYYTSVSTLRLGAEYRITPSFSVRAGYSFSTSPVKEKARNNMETIYTAGTLPSYTFNNTTQYATCGLGYRYDHFYADLSYVYKHMGSTYHAFTPDPSTPLIPSPQANLSLNNSQIVLSCGFKF